MSTFTLAPTAFHQQKESSSMTKTDLLGGRLPLLAQGDLSDEQKPLYQRMRTNQVPWTIRHNFQGMTDDERLIGPFNPILYSPEVGIGFLDFEGTEGRASSLDERVREIVILSVGSVWRSAYELYAHAALARQAGLSDEAIRALENGETAKDLTDKEQLAQTYTLRLTSQHSVEASIYEETERTFGRRGMVDIALLIGRYLTICTLLNGFDIPRP
jgi:4-carboxymuconolactone decarboxylase